MMIRGRSTRRALIAPFKIRISSRLRDIKIARWCETVKT